MNRDHIRGITLAALMVLSVFAAGVGTVSAAGDTELSVNGSSSVDVGDQETYNIVVDSGSDGSQGYSLSVSLSNDSVADIVAADTAGSPSLADDATISSDNSSVDFTGGYTSPLAGATPLTIATVTVEGTAAGSTDLQIDSGAEVRDDSNQPYNITGTNAATISVSAQSPDFQVSNLNAPSSVAQGDTVTATATVTNAGNADGTQDVEFRVGGSVVDSTSVSLSPGASTDVTLSADTSGLAVGSYTHGIFTNDDNQTATITLQAELPDSADAFLQSATTNFWAGQTLYFNGPSADAGEVYALHRVSESGNDKFVGTFVTEVTLNSDGDRFIDTGSPSIGQGEYVLLDDNKESLVVNANGVPVDSIAQGNDVTRAAFTVRNQNFRTSIDDSEVTQGDSTTVSLSSTRGSYAINVSSDSVDESDISDVFPAASGTIVQVNSDSAEIDVNTSSLDAGSYNFTFEVTDTGLSSTEGLTVNPQGEASYSFDFATSRQANFGTFLEVPVNLENTDSAQVRFGSADEGFNVTVPVTDGSGDGIVTIQMNTLTAGFGETSAFSAANGDDSIGTVAYHTVPGDEPLETGSYELVLQNSAGEDQALNSFLLSDRSRGINLALWEAPRDASFETRSDVVGNIGDTVTSSDGTVAFEDNLIHQVEIDDFEAVWDSSFHSGADDTETFLNLINNGQINVDITQTEDSTRQNLDPKELDLAASSNAFTAIYNASNDELYVVTDVTELEFTGNSQSNSAQRNDEFDVTFEVTAQDNVGEETDGNPTESVTETFDVTNRRVALDDPRDVNIQSAANQRITGEASVAPGSEYRVQLRGPNLLTDQTVAVQEDGTFNATFDLSGLAEGDTVRATLSGLGASDTQTYEITQASASVTISDQESADGRFVTVDSVTMSEGGFIAIHEGDAGGDVIGASSYLSEGSHSNVAIRLDSAVSGGSTTLVAMPHQDDNDNQQYDFPSADAPYTANGSPVTDSASVTVPTPEPTTTTTTTPEPTTTTTTTPEPTTTTTTTTPEPTTTTTTTPEPTTTEPEPTTTEDDGTGGAADDADGEDTTTEEGDGPGFTAVLALIALVGAALLAVRRNN